MFEAPDRTDLEKLKDELTVAMLDAVGLMQPIMDAADGMRHDLETRGWSPTMAEQCAGIWLMGAIASATGGKK